MAIADLIQITELSDNFVVCRTIGHSWDDNPNAEVNSDLWRQSVGALALRCVRCSTERFDYVGKDMTVFGRYYRYPDRYRTIPGQGTRPNLRGEMLRRSLLIRSYDNGQVRRRARR
jgi:hypothetical protein